MSPSTQPATVKKWRRNTADTIWVFAQPEGNSSEAGRWCLLTLTSPVGHETALVADGWHVIGQLLDVSRLSSDERDELGDLLSKSSRKREESGLACRERELLSQVPRLSAPGIDVDHAIRRYVLRGPDGEEIAALDVDTQDARDEAQRFIGRIADVEAKDGVRFRLAWSGGPERAGLHADRGLADESAAKPFLLWALLERTKTVCAQAGVPTNNIVARRSLRALASDLRREGWPVREPRAAGSDPGEAITRDAGDKLLVVEVDAPISPERARMLLDRVRRSVPPVWADLVPLNHHPGSRGRLFRPLGGHHKTWSSENSGARKVLVDPEAPAPTPITAALLRPFLAAAEARLARESAATASRRCKGPGSPEAVEAARQRRKELPTKTTVHGRDLIYRDVLPTELAEALDSWAEEHGAAYVNGGNWHQAELGITGVLAAEGIAAEIIGDLLYLSAMSGARSDPETAAAEGERSARGVLEGGRSPGGLGLVREWVGDGAADDLALLAVALAGAENREVLLALPGRMALDERAVGYPDVLDAIRWAQQHDPPTFLWVRMQLSKKGIWRELMRFAHERGRELASAQSGDHSDRYVEDNGRLYEVTQSDRGEARRLLANFTARISEEVHEDDGSGENRSSFEIVAVLHGHDERRCLVPAAQFGLMQWVSDKLGASAILEPGAGVREQVRHAIQILSLPVPRRCLYTHLGWRQLTSGWAYLHAGGALGASGPVPDVEVAPPDALSRFRLPVPPDGTELALYPLAQDTSRLRNPPG